MGLAASADGISKGSTPGQPNKSTTGIPISQSRSLALHMPCVGHELYISGMGGVTNKNILQAQGITHVLNLALELEESDFPDCVNVRCVALRDSEQEDLGAHLDELVEYVHKVIQDGGRIVVNCVAGVSRSASVVLAYKVRHEGLSLHDAFKMVLSARPVISPNLGFWRTLLVWEERERGECTVIMMPHICGMVPELEPYHHYAEMRIKLGWMPELLIMWTGWLVILAVQVIGIVSQ